MRRDLLLCATTILAACSATDPGALPSIARGARPGPPESAVPPADPANAPDPLSPRPPPPNDAGRVPEADAAIAPTDAATRDTGAAMAMAFVGVSSTPAAIVGVVDATLPAGSAGGDFVVAVLYTNVATTTVSAPSGWIALEDLPHTAQNFHGWWFQKTVAAAEAATQSFTLSASVLASMALIAYRGARAAQAIDASVYAVSNGNPFVAPSVSPTRPNTRLVTLFINDSGSGASWTAPSGMTKHADTGLVAIFDALVPAPGVTGTRSATCTVPGGGVVATIAVAPAP